MIDDLAAGMSYHERITFFAECAMREATRRYESGDMAALLYGPEAANALERVMRQFTLELSCRIIGVEAELNRCRNKTGEYEQP